MKKWLILVLIFLTLFIPKANSEPITGSTVTGEAITGNATSGSVAISITVTGPPTLTLIKPENETYFTGTNLWLNFSAFSADSIWYKIDSGSNTTITGNTTFNTTSGPHTLYLFTNNTYGNSSKNVTFTINLTKFVIIYNNYSNNGSTTNLNASSYEDIQNLSGVVLEKSSHGKISFNQAINLTNDSIPADNDLNLDLYTNISSNFIEINTTALPNFNKSATLYLYGLTFTNPRVLRDGIACSASICTEVNYSGGVFIFNVTGFTNYSAEETPAESASPTGGWGGGTTTKFEVIPEEFHITLKQGETIERGMTIKNTGSSLLNIGIEESKLKDFIRISSNSFSLNPGESKTIVLDFLAREDTNPSLYMGKLIVRGGGTEKEIIVAIGVDSKESLFDVEAKIPPRYQKRSPGEELFADIKIYNLGARGAVDVKIEYLIKDKENNTITALGDSIAVETQTSFTKTIFIPENTPLGKYLLYVTVTYNGKIASSSIFFEVAEPEISQREKTYIVVIIILSIIVSLAIYYAITSRERHKKTEKKIGMGMLIKK